MADYDIAAAFEAIENELIDSMIRNFKLHRAEENKEGYLWSQWQAEQLKSLEQYRARNQKKFTKRFAALNAKLEEMLRKVEADGNAAQEAEILKAIKAGFKPPKLPDASYATFFQLNDRKLEALIKATTDDLKSAETAVLRMSDDQYRRSIFNAQVYANTGAATYEKAVDMACRDMLRAGLNCVEYKNGARHTLSDYAEMAIRTANKRAYLYGEGQKRQEWGITTVVVNSRQGGCPRCARYVGKVFIDDVYSGGTKADGGYPLLSEAIKGGLFHPRCKDSASTYFEGITNIQPMTDEEMAEMERREKLEQKESYYKNQAEKNRRIAEHSLDGENKKTYAHRAEQSEKKAAEIAEKLEKTVENSGESGIISLWDNSTEYKPVTPESIDKVPLLNIFDDDAMNKAHQEASRDLLREVMKHDDLPLGTEFSIVYDENMQPIKGCGYRQGKIGKTKIDNPGVPFHAFHNHGSGQTFSFPDLCGFVRQENMLSLTALGNNNNQFVLLSSSIQSKVHYAEFIRVKGQEVLTRIDDVPITLQNIFHQPVFEMIQQTGNENKHLLEKLVVEKTKECLAGAEKYGIKYISFKT